MNVHTPPHPTPPHPTPLHFCGPVKDPLAYTCVHDCTCMYIYIYTHIYTYIHTYTHVYTYIYIYISTCTKSWTDCTMNIYESLKTGIQNSADSCYTELHGECENVKQSNDIYAVLVPCFCNGHLTESKLGKRNRHDQRIWQARLLVLNVKIRRLYYSHIPVPGFCFLRSLLCFPLGYCNPDVTAGPKMPPKLKKSSISFVPKVSGR